MPFKGCDAKKQSLSPIQPTTVQGIKPFFTLLSTAVGWGCCLKTHGLSRSMARGREDPDAELDLFNKTQKAQG